MQLSANAGREELERAVRSSQNPEEISIRGEGDFEEDMPRQNETPIQPKKQQPPPSRADTVGANDNDGDDEDDDNVEIEQKEIPSSVFGSVVTGGEKEKGKKEPQGAKARFRKH